MEILKTIPAKENHPHNVNVITFNLNDKQAYVVLEPAAESHRTIMVNLMPLLQAATPTQKTVIRGFFKKVIAAAAEIAENDLPEIFVEQ